MEKKVEDGIWRGTKPSRNEIRSSAADRGWRSAVVGSGSEAANANAAESVATGIVSIRFVSQSSLGLIFYSVPQRRSPSSRLLSNSDTE